VETHCIRTILAEQRRIVDRIESLFAKLDQAKELAQNALDTFETRKAAILHKAFTGELTAKWREKNGVGMESWEEKRFGDIAEIKSNLVDPKDYFTYPHIAPDNIEKRSGVLLLPRQLNVAQSDRA
jgi:type I restriction enzyme S subunit